MFYRDYRCLRNLVSSGTHLCCHSDCEMEKEDVRFIVIYLSLMVEPKYLLGLCGYRIERVVRKLHSVHINFHML